MSALAPINVFRYARAMRVLNRYAPRFRNALNMYRRARVAAPIVRYAMGAMGGKRRRLIPYKYARNTNRFGGRMASGYTRVRRVAGVKQRSQRVQTFYNSGGLSTGAQLSVFSIPRKSLWSADIRYCRRENDLGGGAGVFGRNQGTKVHVKGLKVCFVAKCISPAASEFAAVVHLGLIQPKSPNDTAPLAEQFFTNPGGGDTGGQKYFDFPDVQVASAWDPRINCNGINNTRFNILDHKKFQVFNSGSQGGPRAHEYVNFEKYYKIGRTFEFKAGENTATDTERPIYAVVWYEEILKQGATASTDMEFNVNTICYFNART